MSIKTTLFKTKLAIAKHSPSILIGSGIVGLGATAYLAYKSKDKVEAVISKVEADREEGIEIDKVEVAKGLVEALYLPVTVGAVSVLSILMSHRIQRTRITALAGALAAQQAHNVYFDAKYRKQHGDEAYAKFSAPTEEVDFVTPGKGGKDVVTAQQIKKDIDHTIGQWFDESSEYASDDHTYNIAWIDSVNEKMYSILFQRGHLLLNEVREALGFSRTRAGALLGWSTGDSFNIEKVITTLGDEDNGELKEQIWVTWTRPHYIYEDVEFNSRYSIV